MVNKNFNNSWVKAKSIEKEAEEAFRPWVKRKKTALETRIYDTMSKLIDYYERYIYPDWYSIIKMKEKFSWDMYVINRLLWHGNRSCSVYPLIESVHDTYKSNLYDSNVTSKATPRKEENREAAEVAQDFMDWSYSVAGADTEKVLIRDEAALIGTSYWLATMIEKESYSVDWEPVEAVYEPYAEHLSALQVYVEPSTKDFYRARNKRVRKIMSLSDAREMYAPMIDFDKPFEYMENGKLYKEERTIAEELLINNDYVSNKDFTKIYRIKWFEQEYITYCINNFSVADITSFMKGDFINDNLMQVDYTTDSLVEVIEDWTNKTLVIMINGRVYYDGNNPYGTCPIGVITYERQPWTHLGIGIGHKLMSHQRQVNTTWNAVNDAIKMHIRPMYSGVSGTVVDSNWQPIQNLEYEDGKVIYTDFGNSANGWFEPIRFIDKDVISICIGHIRTLLNESQEIIGTNSYVQWGQGKVERSFGAVNARMWVTVSRLQPIIHSLNKFDERMFQSRLVAASILMPEWTTIRVLWEDWQDVWKEIKTSDLVNKFDVVVENEAVRQATRAERARIMIESLQTIMPYLYDPITKMPIANVKEVVKYAFEQNNFVGTDIFDDEKLKEYLKWQSDLASFVQWLQQEAQWEPQDPMAWAWEAMSAPLDWLEAQLWMAMWWGEQSLTRGSFE